MKIAYVAFMPTLLVGVEKRIKQIATSSLSLELDWDFIILNNRLETRNKNLIYRKIDFLDFFINKKLQLKLFTHLLIKENIDFDNYDYVILRYPGSCSIGSTYFFEKFGQKLITEHHTNEAIEYLLYRNDIINWLKFSFEDYCARRCLKRVKGLIGVTSEINNLLISKIGDKPNCVFSNGIDVKSINFTPTKLFDGNELKLIFVASKESIWHGLDILIVKIKEFLRKKNMRIELHIVGNLSSRYKEEFIVNYGYLDGVELDELFRKVNVAVSSLSLKRIGLTKGSVLKTREYMARGVPFIYGYDDEDIDDTNYGLKIDIDKFSIDDVISYLRKVDRNFQLEMRDYAEKNLTWHQRIKILHEFLKSLH